MTITTAQLDGILGDFLPPLPDDCFYCAGKLTLPCVLWTGATGHIALHAHCSIALSSHLLRDGETLVRAGAVTRSLRDGI